MSFTLNQFLQIHFQILAVNGISLLNIPYEESLKLLKNTANVVELTVSQIFSEYQQKLMQQQQQQQQQHHHHHHQQQQHQQLQHQKPHLQSVSRESHDSKPFRRNIKATSIHSNAIVQNQQRIATHTTNSLSPYTNDRSETHKTNDNSCLAHDDYDNNNHEHNVTVLITEQINKMGCDVKNGVNSYAHSIEPKAFKNHGFNEISNASDALNCNRRELNDNCLVSAKCMPDLPKVNLQLS